MSEGWIFPAITNDNGKRRESASWKPQPYEFKCVEAVSQRVTFFGKGGRLSKQTAARLTGAPCVGEPPALFPLE